jgi:predicted nucleic acid-binding protein
MRIAYLDTNIIIRLVTGDDPAKQAASQRLFEQLEDGAITIVAPVMVIADAVYVLASPRLYALARPLIRAALSRLLRIPSFRVQHRRALLRALDLYGRSASLDFGDAYLVATMEQHGATALYLYDHDFDQFPSITRHEP